jgi:hypothetical protein
VRTPKPVLAAVCAVLALTGCGGPSQAERTAATSSHTAPRTTRQELPRTQAATVIGFGSEYRFPTGLIVTVSRPNVFAPSDSAYPRSPRAAAFDVILYNDGETSYRLANFSMDAMVSGDPVKQLVDTTRGYNGLADADRDLGPGQTARLTVAFAIHAEPSPMRLILRPEPATSTQVVFRGSV